MLVWRGSSRYGGLCGRLTPIAFGFVFPDEVGVRGGEEDPAADRRTAEERAGGLPREPEEGIQAV